MNERELLELHRRLTGLRDEINAVPGRFDSTARALLAEADAEVIGRASMVLHRLYLWAKYPSVSPESYFPGEPVVRDPDAWAAVAKAGRS